MLAYQPPALYRPGEITITPWSQQSIGTGLYQCALTGGGTSAWPAAGLVVYVPFTVPEPFTITKLVWGIGAAAGNLDAGVYAEGGTLLVSAGSTAAAGTNAQQVVDVTDTTVARGRYYMALVADTVTTLTVYRAAPAAGIAQSFGLLEQASVTLPLSTGASPATFAQYTRAFIPYFGVQGYRTIGP